MNVLTLVKENEQFQGTRGVSGNNRELGFEPAFLNKETGQIEIARLRNGRPARMHLISWLPPEWATDVDDQGVVVSLIPCVIAGFTRDGVFYTRTEAAEL